MLGIILAKADQHRERESDNNVISTDGCGDNSNRDGGLHIKCDAGATGSKLKPKRLRVERSESLLDKNCRRSNVRDLRIRKPDRIITHRSPKHNPGVNQVKKSRVQKHEGKSADVKAKSSDETEVEVAIFGRSSSSKNASDGFRKKLLDVLGQPFDLIELQRLREAVRNGLYYNYHPDLESKLKRCRYERGKCLNILRGFFFWLQNLSQEGAFKPWKDGQSLQWSPHFPRALHHHQVLLVRIVRSQSFQNARF